MAQLKNLLLLCKKPVISQEVTENGENNSITVYFRGGVNKIDRNFIVQEKQQLLHKCIAKYFGGFGYGLYAYGFLKIPVKPIQ